MTKTFTLIEFIEPASAHLRGSLLRWRSLKGGSCLLSTSLDYVLTELPPTDKNVSSLLHLLYSFSVPYKVRFVNVEAE